MRFLGWDLSDPFARRPRTVDVAVVDMHGRVDGVLLFAALHRLAALERLDVDTPEPGRARLFEAFPGATWRRLAVEKLGKKSSPEGLPLWRERLEAAGLRFARGGLPTHDELDAALCAWLGWLTRSPSASTPWACPCGGTPRAGCARAASWTSGAPDLGCHLLV